MRGMAGYVLTKMGVRQESDMSSTDQYIQTKISVCTEIVLKVI